MRLRGVITSGTKKSKSKYVLIPKELLKDREIKEVKYSETDNKIIIEVVLGETYD